MKKRIISLILCLSGLVLLLSSCGKGNKVILLPAYSFPKSCDPQIYSGNESVNIATNEFEGLVRMDEKGNIVPGVAKSWDISKDGLTYTFHLRDNSKWHITNGGKKTLEEAGVKKFDNRVTANDFVFAMQRAVDPETEAPHGNLLKNVENGKAILEGAMPPESLGVEADGDYTLVIRLEKPDINFLDTLTMPLCDPCNSTFFEATKGRYGLSSDFLICNGPYYLSDLNTDSETVTLKKNDDYTGKYKAISETLRFAKTKAETPAEEEEKKSDEDTSLNLYKSLSLKDGGLDAGLIIPLKKDEMPKHLTLIPFENGVKVICFNQNSEFSRNRNLRMAIAYSTDIGKAIGKNEKRASGILPDSLLVTEGHPYRKEAGNATLLPFDPEKAEEYLNAAGGKDKDYNLSLLCLEEDKATVTSLIQNWQKVFGSGLSISVKTYKTRQELLDAMENDKYDIAFLELPFTNFLAPQVLRAYAYDNPDNLIHLNDEAYIWDVTKATTAVDAEECRDACYLAENRLISEGYIIPVSDVTNYMAISKNGKALRFDPSGNIFFAFESGKENDK